MQVKDLMSTDLVTVTPQDTVASAAKLMSQYNIGALPVVTDQNLCGILTDRDIVTRCLAQGDTATACKVGDIMSASAACVMPRQALDDAIHLMSKEQVRRLPVLDNGKLAGMISLADIARSRATSETAEALSEISMP